MVTAQVSGRARYGMNTPDNANRQFVIGAMQWLSGKLEIMTLDGSFREHEDRRRTRPATG